MKRWKAPIRRQALGRKRRGLADERGFISDGEPPPMEPEDMPAGALPRRPLVAPQPDPIAIDDPEPPNDRRDAERWRALLASESIRVISDVPQPYSQPIDGARYLMVEFISHATNPKGYLSRPALIDYADFIREVDKLNSG